MDSKTNVGMTKHRTRFYPEGLVAMITGASGKTLVYAFIPIKKRLQNTGQQYLASQKEWKQIEGQSLRTLYKGASISIAKTMCSQGITLPIYLALSQSGHGGSSNAFAGQLALVATYWLDRWQTRWQTQVVDLRSKTSLERTRLMFGELKQMYREGIVNGLYKGFVSKTISAFPFNFIYGRTYLDLHNWMEKSDSFANVSPVRMNTYSAIVAASLTASLCHPIDTVVTRIQAEEPKQLPVREKLSPASIWKECRSFDRMTSRLYNEIPGSPLTKTSMLLKTLYAGVWFNIPKCAVTYGFRFSLYYTLLDALR